MNNPHLNQLYDSLRSIIQMMDVHSRLLQKKIGVTAPQLSILIALAAKSPQNVTELSKKVHLTVGTISGTINRLGKNGLMQRIDSLEDKRKIFFVLAPKASEILNNGALLFPDNFIINFVNSLSDWEQYMILSSMKRLNYLMHEQVHQSEI